MKDFLNSIYEKKWLRFLLGILFSAILLTVFIVITFAFAYDNNVTPVDGSVTNAEARFFNIVAFISLDLVFLFGFICESDDYEEGWLPFFRFALPPLFTFSLAIGATFIKDHDITYVLANGMIIASALLQIYQTIQRNKEKANDNPWVFKFLIPLGILVGSTALFGFLLGKLPLLSYGDDIKKIEYFRNGVLLVGAVLQIVAVCFVIHYTFFGFLSWALFFTIIGAIILAICGGFAALMFLIPNQIGFIVAAILAMLLTYATIFFYDLSKRLFPLFFFSNILFTVISMGVGFFAIREGKTPLVTQFGFASFLFGGTSFLYNKIILNKFRLSRLMVFRCIISGALLAGCCVLAFTRTDLEAGAALTFSLGGGSVAAVIVLKLLKLMFWNNDLIGDKSGLGGSGGTGQFSKFLESDLWYLCYGQTGSYDDYHAACDDVRISGSNQVNGYYQHFDVEISVSVYRYRNNGQNPNEGCAKEAANQLIRNIASKLYGKGVSSYRLSAKSLTIKH